MPPLLNGRNKERCISLKDAGNDHKLCMSPLLVVLFATLHVHPCHLLRCWILLPAGIAAVLGAAIPEREDFCWDVICALGCSNWHRNHIQGNGKWPSDCLLSALLRRRHLQISRKRYINCWCHMLWKRIFVQVGNAWLIRCLQQVVIISTLVKK